MPLGVESEVEKSMSSELNPELNPASQVLEALKREHIGAQLEGLFVEAEREPITDEQVDLLLALRRVERERQRA